MKFSHINIEKTYAANVTFPDGFQFSLNDTPAKDNINAQLIKKIEQSLCIKRTQSEHWDWVMSNIDLKGMSRGDVGFFNNLFKQEFNNIFRMLDVQFDNG